MNNLPNNWQWSTLGEISEKPQYGWTTKANHENGSVKLLRTTDITSGELDWSSVPYCTDSPEDLEKYLVKSGDIVISRAGSVGYSFLVSNVEKAVFASYLIRFRIKNRVEKKYVYYYLKSPAYWEAIGASKSGIAVPNVNASKLSKVLIPIAPIEQQKLIVAEIEKQFSRLDEAVANLKRVKANLKRYKAAVLKAAVEGKLTAEWRKAHPDVEPADKLLQRVSASRNKWIEIETNKGNSEAKRLKTKLKNHKFNPTEDIELPKNWLWASFLTASQLVVDCHNKTAPYEDNGIKLLRTTNIRDGKIDLYTSKYISQETYEYWSRRCPPEPGDILFTREAPMGEAAIIPEGVKVCMGQRMMLIRLFDNLVSAKYFLYTILSPTFQSRLGHGAVGSGVKHLRVGDVESLTVPIPPIDEQYEIVNHIESKLSVILEIVQEIDSNMQRVECLRQSILSKAFSGELLNNISIKDTRAA